VVSKHWQILDGPSLYQDGARDAPNGNAFSDRLRGCGWLWEDIEANMAKLQACSSF
jgi:hypothetical protein